MRSMPSLCRETQVEGTVRVPYKTTETASRRLACRMK
jgi:hypothetical protein